MKIIIFIIYCVIFPLSCFANWPIFIAPDKGFLLQPAYLDTTHCRPGDAKLRGQISIPIDGILCKSYCPANWVWKTFSDHQCHPLTHLFNFAVLTIDYVRDQHGSVLNSKVTIHYDDGQQLIFTSPAKAHWSCYEMNPSLHSITCADDT